LDWFSLENLCRKPWFSPFMGVVSCKLNPLKESNETRQRKIHHSKEIIQDAWL
jgi:hypothetical protein